MRQPHTYMQCDVALSIAACVFMRDACAAFSLFVASDVRNLPCARYAANGLVTNRGVVLLFWRARLLRGLPFQPCPPVGCLWELWQADLAQRLLFANSPCRKRQHHAKWAYRHLLDGIRPHLIAMGRQSRMARGAQAGPDCGPASTQDPARRPQFRTWCQPPSEIGA